MRKQKTTRIVLDTHTFLWLMLGKELSQKIQSLIETSAQNKELYLSAISLWEIAMLENKGRIILSEPCLLWLQQATSIPGLNLVPLSAEISVDSVNLPKSFHGDPADRIIVATARQFNAVLFTRDKKILSYAKEGYVESVEI